MESKSVLSKTKNEGQHNEKNLDSCVNVFDIDKSKQNAKSFDGKLPEGAASMESTETQSTNDHTDHISLRPNNMMPFMSHTQRSESPASPPAVTGTSVTSGRKRHHSTNEEATQSFLHAQRTNPNKSNSIFDQNASSYDTSKYQSAAKKPVGSWRDSKVIRNMEPSAAIQVEAERHCSKFFTLKSSEDTKSEAEVAGLFVLPPADQLLNHPDWIVKGLQQVKDRLNDTKQHAERGENMNAWTKHTFDVNPAAGVFNEVKDIAKPELLTQAFLKFYEILCQYPIVSPDCTSVASVHLCEAPGAFIVALNHYLKLHRPNAEWQWVGNTLHPHYEGCLASACITDDRVILGTLHNWAFGDGTGNIMLRSCLEDLEQRCAGLGTPITLVTADGSIDCQTNPGEQETMTSHLHYCEVLAGLKLLAKGGNMVVKMFTFFEAMTISLLYLLCCVFNNVSVFKPITSKLGNSEVYVVSMYYVGRDQIAEQLTKLLSGYTPKAVGSPIFSLSQIPPQFLVSLSECAEFFMTHQKEAIQRNVNLYNNMTEENVASCCHLQDLVQLKFRQLNPIKQIEHCQRMLRCGTDWDRNIYPAFDQQNKWTGYFMRDDQAVKLRYCDSELDRLTKHYARLEKKPLYFLTTDVLDEIKVTKGVPFSSIGTSRFCYSKLLNLYTSYIDIKQTIRKLLPETLKSTETRSTCSTVVHMTGTEEHGHEAEVSQYNSDTTDLIDSIKEDYPESRFLLEPYPNHVNPPTSSCETLDHFFSLLANNCLSEGCTIHLINFPLLSRLQNSFFVALCSCFKEVELHQGLHYQLCTGKLTPPTLALKGLSVAVSVEVVARLRDAGWTPGAAKEGVMEVIGCPSLITSSSHELVCRYNTQLLLVWSQAIARQIQSLVKVSAE